MSAAVAPSVSTSLADTSNSPMDSKNDVLKPEGESSRSSYPALPLDKTFSPSYISCCWSSATVSDHVFILLGMTSHLTASTVDCCFVLLYSPCREATTRLNHYIIVSTVVASPTTL